MTLYMVSYFGAIMIGPIIAGAMTQHINWQSFWWFNVALFGFLILLVLFGFPETKYTGRGEQQQTLTTPSTTGNGESSGKVAGELAEAKSDDGLDTTKVESKVESSAGKDVETVVLDPWLHRGYPSKHQYPTIWYPRLTKGNFAAALVRDFWIPWKLFAYPIVQYAAFVFSWSASNFLVVNLTQSQVFAAPPYNFSPQNVGFTNFAVFGGALFGLATAGPLSDWVAMRQTIRNNGIREPEMRLLALIPYTVLLFLGSL